MAYQGRKVVNAGEVFSASDMNSTIDQTVMVFAGTAARSSAVPTPTEGMVSYLEDVNEVQFFDGSVWGSVAPTPVAPVVPYLEMVSGSYYRPQGNYAATTAVTSTQYFSPLFVPFDRTFDRIGIRTASSTFTGTASVRLGIYANGGGLPTTLVADYGTVSPSTSSTNFELTISQSLTAGFYWLSCDVQTAPGTGQWQGLTAAAASQSYQNLPVTLTTTGGANMGYSQTGITGAFASVSGSLTQATAGPVAFVRAV